MIDKNALKNSIDSLSSMKKNPKLFYARRKSDGKILSFYKSSGMKYLFGKKDLIFDEITYKLHYGTLKINNPDEVTEEDILEFIDIIEVNIE